MLVETTGRNAHNMKYTFENSVEPENSLTFGKATFRKIPKKHAPESFLRFAVNRCSINTSPSIIMRACNVVGWTMYKTFAVLVGRWNYDGLHVSPPTDHGIGRFFESLLIRVREESLFCWYTPLLRTCVSDVRTIEISNSRRYVRIIASCLFQLPE